MNPGVFAQAHHLLEAFVLEHGHLVTVDVVEVCVQAARDTHIKDVRREPGLMNVKLVSSLTARQRRITSEDAAGKKVHK